MKIHSYFSARNLVVRVFAS